MLAVIPVTLIISELIITLLMMFHCNELNGEWPRMDMREDRLLALVGLLIVGLITVVVLFTLTWLSDVRRIPAQPSSQQTCLPENYHPS